MNRKPNIKRNIKPITAFLLSFLLLFQTNIAFATTGTAMESGNQAEEWEPVSGNQPAENEPAGSEPAGSGESEEGTKPGENPDDTEGSSLNEEEDLIQDTVSGQDIPKIQTGAGTGPANPIHHCNKEDGNLDDTDFSYIYFGSYPQSEITDSATRAAIDKAIPVSGIEIEAGIEDVWINGTKYRRINEYDPDYENYGDDVANNGCLYFKWERIKWKVLKNDGETLFVVADKAIDSRYDSNRPWEERLLRKWLNDDFYHAAFNSDEQGAIVTRTVVNEDNPEYGTAGGNDTMDTVYFLSIREATNTDYGFCSDYQVESKSRRIAASDYSRTKGGNGWWLRSPGCGDKRNWHTGAYVESSGEISLEGYNSAWDLPGICPALHINLSQTSWSMTDDGTSGMGGDEKAARPAASLSNGSRVVKNTKLSFSCATKEADIYYTTDGTTPTTSSARYTGVITIDRNMTVKAVAVCRGYRISDVLEVSYKVYEIKAQKLSILAPSKKLAAGKKVKLTLKFIPENATNNAVKWNTSNEKYAVVDKDGRITLKKEGVGRQVTITAAAQDGSGKKASIKIKIMQHAVKSIKLKASKKNLKAGQTMTVKVTVKTTGSNANKTLKWTSSNKEYATVNSKGKVTAKKAGKGKQVTITAASTDGSNKKAAIKINIK